MTTTFDIHDFPERQVLSLGRGQNMEVEKIDQ